MNFGFLEEREHRTAPWPSGPWVMRMGWHGLLFAHWEVEPGSLAQALPPGLELDTYQGRAFIGIVPFEMQSVGPWKLPGVPTARRFPELNLRTYVRFREKPAVWFFSLDAASGLAVWGARTLFHLPYFRARMEMRADGEGWHYQSERSHSGAPPARFSASYGPEGERFLAKPGSLEHWLTERYSLVSAKPNGRLLEGPIHHKPWPLQQAYARFESNTMAASLGLDLSGPPASLLYAEHLDVVAWPLR